MEQNIEVRKVGALGIPTVNGKPMLAGIAARPSTQSASRLRVGLVLKDGSGGGALVAHYRMEQN